MTEPSTARRNQVVRFHYAIRNDAGVEVETSRGGEPVLALLGFGNLMPGLEEAILGHSAGESFSRTLAPEQAFGPRREDWIQRISKKHFPAGTRFQPGVTLRIQTDQGARTVTVLKVGSKFVDVDLNHPLAGQTVTFTVDLEEVRDATREELAHRHAHGNGGHHH
jgi:FKBP-type peptidyl-prolyl cis-trans isomerase SlyD